MGLAYCFSSGGRLDSDICEPPKYDEAHRWGTLGGQRGSGASLSSVSVSPAVATLRAATCWEGKFHLAFLGEDDDTCGKGGNMLGVDGDNHRSGLLGAPRLSARVKVPG